MCVSLHAVLRCLNLVVWPDVMAVLEDSPRPGNVPQITDEANALLV